MNDIGISSCSLAESGADSSWSISMDIEGSSDNEMFITCNDGINNNSIIQFVTINLNSQLMEER